MSNQDAQWLEDMPSSYDSGLGDALFRPYARHVAALARDLAPTRVLELAAGTGILTAELVAALPDATITATDLNPPMVAWAAEHVPGARWQVADAQHLELPDGSFDLVACQFGAMFFPDRPRAYAQSARVLAPGGTLLLAIWDVLSASTFPSALAQALALVLPEDPPTFVARVPHGYADPAVIEADLVSGGLRVGSLDRVTLTGNAPSAASLARGFCLGSPLRFELSKRGELEVLTAAVAASMTGLLGAGPLVGDLSAWVVTASA